MTRPKFYAGWNTPGCLPETPYEEFDTFEDAREYLVDALKRFEDDEATEDNEAGAEAFCHAAEDVNLWAPGDSGWVIYAGGLAFEIFSVARGDTRSTWD
jgi:hypothetical protein